MANPSLATVLSTTVTEDTYVALAIEAAPALLDGSEYLTLEISGIPGGWTASGIGTFNAATGTWSLTLAAGMTFSGGPTLTPLANTDIDIAGLTVTARSFSTATDALIGTRLRLIEVITDAAADAPTVLATSVNGNEDTSVALDIQATLADTDGSESFTSITILDVPAGFSVTGGTSLGGGIWQVPVAALATAALTGPANYYGTVDLRVITVNAETTLSGDEPNTANNSVTTERAFSVTFNDVNDPATVALSASVAALAENADTALSMKMADISIADDTLGTNTLSLSGADASLFEISGGALYLKAGAALDFESNPVLDVTVSVDDPAIGGTPDSSQAFALTLTDVNEAPTVTFANVTAELPETASTSAPIKIADIVVADDALGTNTLSLSGADAGKFVISGGALYLAAGTALNFETNAAFDVTVSVDDATLGAGADDSQALTLQISDVNEAPTALDLSAAAIAENNLAGATVATLSAADADTAVSGFAGPFTYALVPGAGGTDNAAFSISGDQLKITAAANFEAKSSYSIRLKVTDAGGQSFETTKTIAVTDVNEAPTAVTIANPLNALPEGSGAPSQFNLGTIAVSDDALGSYTLSLSGADAQYFTINDGSLFFSSATAPWDYETKSSYQVTINANDPTVGGAVDASTVFTFQVLDAPEAPTNITLMSVPVREFAANGTIVGTLAVADQDAGDTHSYTLINNAGGRFALVGNQLTVANGLLLDYEQAASHVVSVKVTDHLGYTYTKSLTVGVGDINPEIVSGDGAANTFAGGAQADILNGLGGNDTLIGGAGADTMTGGLGNDIFIVDNMADKAFEAVGQGTNDYVYATNSFALAAGQEIEGLSANPQAGTNPINLTGNEFRQIIRGNNGVNTLLGGGGNDNPLWLWRQ
ncbi:MAG: hypothetical protein HOP09_14405 [Hyphomicrobium sp.]|nr:hypothetical protein [Hyphomicrobium sp.]